MMLLLLFFATQLVGTICVAVEPSIVYKFTDVYSIIWSDRGSGADRDGSIWQAQNYNSDYCSLGDVAVDGHAQPSVKTVLVSSSKGALVQPVSFTKVWTDSGSGADWDVSIYTMVPPSGYTCLGGVAVRSGSILPDTSKYCCVKNEFVTRGQLELAWNDKGSGANADVSLYSIIRNVDVFGVNSGHFYPLNYYPTSTPTEVVYQLKADGENVRDVWSMTVEAKPINIYEVQDVKWIWDDAGSGARYDVSIWRAETQPGYFTVTDVAVKSHGEPGTVFLVTTTDPIAIRPPVDYTKIWSDRGSGADDDVSIWRANCPPSYVALGNVATSGSPPQVGDIYCVHSKHTVQASTAVYNGIWTDSGSGADDDVAIFEAHSSSSDTQGVRGMYSIANSASLPSPPYLLNARDVAYFSEKPIASITLSNVQYDLGSEKQLTAPIRMNPTVIENNSDLEQSVSRTISVATSTTSTWSLSTSVQVGTSVELSAGIPLVTSAKTTVSVSVTVAFSYGESNTETKTDTVRADITLPKKSRITATVTLTEYKTDIPFTADTRKVYYDGTVGYGTTSGIWKGVSVSEAKVTYGEIEYFV
jgi:hypothetical protein